MLDKKIKSQLNDLSYNAYCLVGGETVSQALVRILEKNFGIKKTGNQDFFYFRDQNLTIDDTKNLKKIHESRPVVVGGRKIFVICVDNINVEAQNALLKLLEEPAQYAYFFIIIPRVSLLLPTVKSRLHLIFLDHNNNLEDDIVNDVNKFLSSSRSKKLDLVKKITDDISKEKKSKQYAIEFVNEIQNQIKANSNLADSVIALNASEKVLKYLNDRSPSVKMLLEYLALNL